MPRPVNSGGFSTSGTQSAHAPIVTQAPFARACALEEVCYLPISCVLDQRCPGSQARKRADLDGLLNRIFVRVNFGFVRVTADPSLKGCGSLLCHHGHSNRRHRKVGRLHSHEVWKCHQKMNALQVCSSEPVRQRAAARTHTDGTMVEVPRHALKRHWELGEIAAREAE
jgi:hypothetical protein